MKRAIPILVLLVACGGGPRPEPVPADDVRPVLSLLGQFGGGHDSVVRVVVTSQDGRWVASGGEDGIIRLWDLSLGIEVKVLARNRMEIRSMAFSADGRRLAVTDGEAVSVWDLDSGQKALSLDGHEFAVNAVDCSPDGKYIVSGSSDNRVIVWDASSGKKVREMPSTDMVVTLDAGNKDIAGVLLDGSIRVWDIEQGRETRVVRAEKGRFTCARFSPDGRVLAGGTDQRDVIVVDAGNGRTLASLHGHLGQVRCIDIAGDTIVSGSWDGTIRLWDMKEWKEKAVLKGHEDKVHSVAITADGKSVISASADISVRIWDAVEGKESLVLTAHKRMAMSLAFSPDGKTLASAGEDRLVRLWSVPSMKPVASLSGAADAVSSVAFSSDGKFIGAIGKDGELLVWELEGRKISHRLKAFEGTLSGLSASPNRQYMAAGGLTGAVKVWNLPDNLDYTTLDGHAAAVRCVAFSPDSGMMVSGDEAGVIRVWDIPGWKSVATLKGHRGAVTSVGFAQNWIVSASCDKTIRFWTPTTGDARPALAHLSEVSAMAVAPDRRRIIAGAADSTLQIWDSATGAKLVDFKAHEKGILALAVSPDGAYLATCSRDVSIKLWKIDPALPPPPPAPK